MPKNVFQTKRKVHEQPVSSARVIKIRFAAVQLGVGLALGFSFVKKKIDKANENHFCTF